MKSTEAFAGCRPSSPPRRSPARERCRRPHRRPQLLVYTALETDQMKAYEERVLQGGARRRDQVGPRLDRRHHGETPCREGQSAGRLSSGAWRRRASLCSRTRACCSRTRRWAWQRSRRSTSDSKNPPDWWGMRRVGRDRLLQHGRSGEDEPAQARNVAGPDQAGLQGQDRDAQSGVVRHRLPGRDGVAADLWRSGWLEIHGRPAREHRAVHAFGQQAVRAGAATANSRSASRSNTAPSRSKPRAGRSTSIFPKEGLGWDLEAVRHHEDDQEARCREETRGLGVDAAGDGALREELRDRRHAGRRAAACPTFPPITRSGW